MQSLSQWSKNGTRTLEMDKRIVEMICVDAAPLSIVERSGFIRLIKYAAPHYELKSQRFYLNQVGKIFEKLSSRMKEDLLSVNYMSFTVDAWSNETHDLLSLTAHFLTEDFEPVFLVLGALPIKGRHTALNFSEMLRGALEEFQIPPNKVHLVLRDSAASMRKTTALMDVGSSDCFLHVLQLAINDGLNILSGLSDILENVKVVVKKVRKSGIITQHLKVLQKNLDFPEHTLTKGVIVRWNWTYLMLVRFLENKQSISLLALDFPSLPSFSEMDWRLLEAITALLKPIYDVTLDLQSRRSSIANVIPIFRSLSHMLNKVHPIEAEFNLSTVRFAIANGLETRMRSWNKDRNLILATALDPRYKMKFFEPENVRQYRDWLEEELNNTTGFQVSISNQVKQPVEIRSNGIDAVIEEYLQDQTKNNTLGGKEEQLDEVTKAKIELVAYLEEPCLKKADPYKYWKSQKPIWPHLARLVQKFHSAPVGSQESERLFTAGYIVNDLPKSLSHSNLKMLLFLHHNLPLYDYEY